MFDYKTLFRTKKTSVNSVDEFECKRRTIDWTPNKVQGHSFDRIPVLRWNFEYFSHLRKLHGIVKLSCLTGSDFDFIFYSCSGIDSISSEIIETMQPRMEAIWIHGKQRNITLPLQILIDKLFTAISSSESHVRLM